LICTSVGGTYVFLTGWLHSVRILRVDGARSLGRCHCGRCHRRGHQ
jgi:hypothetical protein